MTKGMQSVLLLLVAGVIVAALTLWRAGLLRPGAPEVPVALEPELQVSQVEALPEAATSYPLETQALPRPLKAREIRKALTDLLGRDATARFLQIDDFPRRVVATVDNLGRPHAPHLLWPVNPTPDRFTVDDSDGPVIAADNADRYTPFVLLAESADARRMVDLYVRMYPTLQAAYEELGFPGRYFNDRVIAVIDLLLATPELDYPLQLQLTEVRGLIPSLRPWTRYEFADPALESLSSGQKMLLRVGLVNQRRLKGKLAEIRAEIVKRRPAR
jgi:hypothetical protein